MNEPLFACPIWKPCILCIWYGHLRIQVVVLLRLAAWLWLCYALYVTIFRHSLFPVPSACCAFLHSPFEVELHLSYSAACRVCLWALASCWVNKSFETILFAVCSLLDPMVLGFAVGRMGRLWRASPWSLFDSAICGNMDSVSSFLQNFAYLLTSTIFILKSLGLCCLCTRCLLNGAGLALYLNASYFWVLLGYLLITWRPTIIVAVERCVEFMALLALGYLLRPSKVCNFAVFGRATLTTTLDMFVIYFIFRQTATSLIALAQPM